MAPSVFTFCLFTLFIFFPLFTLPLVTLPLVTLPLSLSLPLSPSPSPSPSSLPKGFVDTMSLHTSINGMSSRQRVEFMRRMVSGVNAAAGQAPAAARACRHIRLTCCPSHRLNQVARQEEEGGGEGRGGG